jgi:hypothetical protein
MNGHMRLSFVVLSILALSAAPAQAASCGPCEVARVDCSTNCFGREDKTELQACLITCENAAATCSCDEAVTLRSEDFVVKSTWRSTTALLAACHATTPCGSAYPSCGSWSSYSNCDAVFCGIGPGCGDCSDPVSNCGPGPAMRQRRERFRVCFNALGQHCTEYQRATITLVCGC